MPTRPVAPADSSDPRLGTLAAEVGDRVDAQLASAQREIDEVRAILRDAIARLLPAFRESHGGDSGESVPPAFGEAFQALQFQDISDQLLAHAQSRIGALRKALAPAAPQVAPGGEATVEQLCAAALTMRDDLAQLDAKLVKPVDAPHLETGHSELF